MEMETVWTQFWDMHSGGGQKEKWHYIYIEAPEEEAKVIFYNRFGHNAERVTCTCCGEDYSISEHKDLEQATGYHRGCAWEKDGYVERTDGGFKGYTPLKEYLKSEDCLFIFSNDIKPEERVGEVPEEGYVWQ